MSLAIIHFEPKFLRSVSEFWGNMWAFRRSEAFYRWRYLDCPNQIGVLAMQGDECVAMVWAFIRTYRSGGKNHRVLETCDWYTRRDLRGAGIGVRVMQSLMNLAEPIVAVGGSQDTLQLLPRMRWQPSGESIHFALPLKGTALGRVLERRLNIPSAWTEQIAEFFTSRWFIKKQAPAAGWKTLEETRIRPEIARLYEEQTAGTVSLPDIDYYRWLLHRPQNQGRYLVHYFLTGEHLNGWSFARLYPSEGALYGSLIEVQTTDSNPETLAWIVNQTVEALAQVGAVVARTHTNRLLLQQALRKNRFLRTTSQPILIWSGEKHGLDRPIAVGSSASDFAIFPYESV